jgi:hypothetical protein
VNEPAGTCSALRRGGGRWPWMQKLYTWGSLAGVSGRFTDNCIEIGSWTVCRSTWQEMLAFWYLWLESLDYGTQYMLCTGSATITSLPFPSLYIWQQPNVGIDATKVIRDGE